MKLIYGGAREEQPNQVVRWIARAAATLLVLIGGTLTVHNTPARVAVIGFATILIWRFSAASSFADFLKQRPLLLVALAVTAFLVAGRGLMLLGAELHHNSVVTIAIGAVLSVAVLVALLAAARQLAGRLSRARGDAAYDGPTVCLGTTTGLLARNGHARGARRGVKIELRAREIGQSILVLGETGAAKTSAAITPIVKQLLASNASFLFIDGKGDMAGPIARLAARLNRVVKHIGIGALRINLLRGFTPQQGAKIVVEALRLSGQTGSDSAFWISNATNLVENALSILSTTPRYYNLYHLYRFTFNEAFRKERLAEATEHLIDYQARVDGGDSSADAPKRSLRMACEYFSDVYATMNEKTRNDINATIGTVLQPFQNPAILDAFCAQQDEADLEELDSGVIFVLTLSLAEYDLVAPFVFMFVKQRYDRHVKNRASLPYDDPRRKLLTGMIMDEYQKIASATDADSLDVIRSLGGFYVAGTQSVNALERVLGSKETTYALLQNFVQKICFGTSDVATIEYFASVVGEVDVERLSTSQTHGPAASSSISQSLQRMKVITGQTFRGLGQDKRNAAAVALLKINGHAYDDVIIMPKLYAEDLEN